MKEPVDHILRPKLPWREQAAMTECGFDATKVPVLTREQYFQRLKDYGRQRTAMLTCITCADTTARWVTWDDDPRKALDREIQWECGWGRRTNHGHQLRDELHALAELIEAHREEFDTLIARREWIEKKAARAGAAK